MSDYKFSDSQRWAVFTTYGQKCYLCTKPIDLQSMEIDHVLPESLLKDPAKLSGVLIKFGLPSDFDLNDYGNWLPACSSCNSVKLGRVFNPTPIVQAQIERAREKAEKAKLAAEEVVTNRSLSIAVNKIIRASNESQIAKKHFVPLIESMLRHDPELRDKVKQSIRVPSKPGTLGLMIQPPKVQFTPFYSILFEHGHTKIVRTPYGVGYMPNSEHPHSSFRCGSCGSLGPWSGARCLTCGHLSDD